MEAQSIIIKPEIRQINHKYSSETGIYLGKLLIASYGYDGLKAKGELHNYRVSGHLPIIKSDLGKFVTQEEAEKRLLNVMEYVLTAIQFVPSENNA